MTDESGIMSVDFMVGFTVFMIAFIWVATMVPGLFIGLQSRSIDFDSVAYRTGVILTEDPGSADTITAGNNLPWEMQKAKWAVIRFGLAISKDSPRILSAKKIDRFFCSTDFHYPEDYNTRVIFSDYPYRYNITLRESGSDVVRSVGEVIPPNYPYGYIRRDVKIKGESNSTIGKNLIDTNNYYTAGNSTTNEFRIVINNTYLKSDPVGNIGVRNGDRAYRIEPQKERILINFTDLNTSRKLSKATDYNVTIADVKFFVILPGGPADPASFTIPSAYENFIYMNTSSTGLKAPVNINKDDNVSMIFEPGIFPSSDDASAILINISFNIEPTTEAPDGQPYLNNTHALPFSYDYNPARVTQPALRDAVLEVAVW